MKIAVVAERVREVVATLGRHRGGQGRRARAHPRRHPRQRPRADRGLSRASPRRSSPGSWPRRSTSASAASSSRPTCCRATSPAASSTTSARAGSSSAPGPVFTNLLLADEINRATPKTQAALLEAMQEAQVTIEGQSFPLEQPFLVIATQNPIELEGTYPLPEAQLDRFLLRVGVGYPERRRRARDPAAAAASGAPTPRPSRPHHPHRAPGHAGGARGRVRERGARALHRGAGPGHADRLRG